MEEKISLEPVAEKPLEPAEPQYFISPHPTAAAPLSVETASPGRPVTAEDTIAELVQQAVSDLRDELQAELETQVFRMQSDLRAELKIEQKEITLNGKN